MTIPEPLSKIAEELAEEYANPKGLKYEDLRIPVSNNFKRAAEDFLAGFAAACANDKLVALIREQAFLDAAMAVEETIGYYDEGAAACDSLAAKERAKLLPISGAQ